MPNWFPFLELKAHSQGHSNNGGVEESKLLMRAFWKLSDQLNGMSVDAFKELVADLVAELQIVADFGRRTR